MKNKLFTALAVLATVFSLPANAVVSLHGASPHAFTSFLNVSTSGLSVLVLGVAIVAFAMTYRYLKASR